MSASNDWCHVGLCRGRMAEAGGKRAQRMAEAIAKAADKAEAQISAQARKDRAAAKQRQQDQDSAKAEQQKQQRVNSQLLPCAPTMVPCFIFECSGSDSGSVLSKSSDLNQAKIWCMRRRRR